LTPNTTCDIIYSQYEQEVTTLKILSSDLNKKFKIKYDEDFDLNYQLKFDINTLRPNGMEALLRIKNSNSNQSPLSVIKQAEDNNEIHYLGMWVIEKSLHDFHNFLKNNYNDITIAINVSPIQLTNKNFFKDVMTLAERYDIDHNKIQLELTEDSPVLTSQSSIEQVIKLKEVGFKIAIDDFGAGFTSLAYLSKLNPDVIKLDKIFADDYKSEIDLKVVSGVAHLCQSLNITTVIEGIESEQQLLSFSHTGVDTLQGYHLHIPSNPEEIEIILSRDKLKHLNSDDSKIIEIQTIHHIPKNGHTSAVRH